jgi:CubicO group peptidase (beta-lactamase class C family)
MATVVDMYGTAANPLYTAIWVKNATLTLGSHGLGAASMQQQIDERAALGYRPLWVSGLGSASNNSPSFAGIWVQDTLTGTMKINLTAADIGAKGTARDMVNKGYHMTHLSGYATQDGTRYAAVWVKGTACPADRWEAFRDATSTKFQIKASAQRKVSGSKTVAANSITLGAGDIGATFRIGRVSVRNTNGAPVELNTINSQLPVSNGTILVLQPEQGHAITVVERAAGNLKLRAWKPGVVGQSFGLNNYQYRLTLQYNAGLQKWVELDRNNISPDYYWPTSVDEYGPSDARRYNSIWKAGPVDRVWRVTGTPAGTDTLGDFDQAMRSYMQRSNVPNGTLAIAVDGKLVLARGYSWTPANVPSVAPDAGFRLASVSKPLTSIAVMQLVEDGLLNLDWKIKDIPGFDAILQSNLWADADIKKVTVRHLLSHTGGWDRDLADDPMLNDWNVCAGQNPDTLPTTFTSILDYTRGLPIEHAPGSTYAYSNFGYALLGRIIQHVSGQSYESYMKTHVFAPVGAAKTQLGGNVTQLPGEVVYYRPDNRMGSSVLGFGAGQPADRQVCNPNHANIAHVAYGGGFNIDPMAAHGAWVSTGVDLARVLVGLEENTLLTPAARNTMWSRPENRGQRVAVYDNASKLYQDYTLQAREDTATFTGLDSTGDIMFIGQGVTKFEQLNFSFATPGQGYAVKLLYLKSGGGYGTLGSADKLSDGTLNLSKSGTASFTAPKDWAASVISTVDPQPKFYLLAYTTANPGVATSIQKLTLNGEASYGLGWGVGDVTNTLKYASGTALLVPDAMVVGQLSKASAKIIAVNGNAAAGTGTLTLSKVSGGSFRPGEKLLINAVVAAKATEREWSQTADTSHSGLLWGTSTSIKHRANNVDWVVLLNQDSAYDPYWYLPSNTIGGTIDSLAKNQNSWPAIDLFNQFP